LQITAFVIAILVFGLVAIVVLLSDPLGKIFGILLLDLLTVGAYYAIFFFLFFPKMSLPSWFFRKLGTSEQPAPSSPQVSITLSVATDVDYVTTVQQANSTLPTVECMSVR